MSRLTKIQINRGIKKALKDKKPLSELKDLYAWEALGRVGFIPNREKNVL